MQEDVFEPDVIVGDVFFVQILDRLGQLPEPYDPLAGCHRLWVNGLNQLQ